MKISLFDSNNGKFSNVLRFHWKDIGHEVSYTPLWDSRMCVDADTIFFDWVDTSVQRASDPDDQQYKDHGTTIPTGKNIIARCHDIDMWVGNLHGVRDGFIRRLVFVADHIRKIAEERGEIPKGCEVVTINHGIDTKKFTEKSPNGQRKIGWIGRYDHNKHPELALEILMELPRSYSLHLVGRRHQAAWQIKYWENLIKKNELNVVFEEDIPDMNVWWEDKDYVLSTSGKEAFSYSTAEAMAKGVKPIIHRFYGAEEVWPEEYIFDSVSTAASMIISDEYNSREYRKYIQERYPIEKFYAAYDALL